MLIGGDVAGDTDQPEALSVDIAYRRLQCVVEDFGAVRQRQGLAIAHALALFHHPAVMAFHALGQFARQQFRGAPPDDVFRRAAERCRAGAVAGQDPPVFGLEEDRIGRGVEQGPQHRFAARRFREELATFPVLAREQGQQQAHQRHRREGGSHLQRIALDQAGLTTEQFGIWRQIGGIEMKASQSRQMHDREVRTGFEHRHALGRDAAPDVEYPTCGLDGMDAMAHHVAAQQAVADTMLPQVVDRNRGVLAQQRQRFLESLGRPLAVKVGGQQQNGVAGTEVAQLRCQFAPAHFGQQQLLDGNPAKGVLLGAQRREVAPPTWAGIADHPQALQFRLQVSGHADRLGDRDVLDHPCDAGVPGLALRCADVVDPDEYGRRIAEHLALLGGQLECGIVGDDHGVVGAADG